MNLGFKKSSDETAKTEDLVPVGKETRRMLIGARSKDGWIFD
jgi:hypothetical protein